MNRLHIRAYLRAPHFDAHAGEVEGETIIRIGDARIPVRFATASLEEVRGEAFSLAGINRPATILELVLEGVDPTGMLMRMRDERDQKPQ